MKKSKLVKSFDSIESLDCILQKIHTNIDVTGSMITDSKNIKLISLFIQGMDLKNELEKARNVETYPEIIVKFM